MVTRKGMGMALTLVVTAVVLIVISLVIISIVTGGLSKFGASNDEQMTGASEATTDTIAYAHCSTQKGISSGACCHATYGGEDCDIILGGPSTICDNPAISDGIGCDA